MNSCEKMQIARMNLSASRGRSLETLTQMALRELRKERKAYDHAYVVEGETCCGYVPYGFFSSLRKARFWQLRTMRLKGLECVVSDSKTGIQIY